MAETHEYEELCSAVGKLILNFSRLENSVSAGLRLHLTFRLKKHKKAGALNLAGAIYGSMRLKTSTMIMRRLMVEEDEDTELFDALFGHVGHIRDLRDKLAHQALLRVPDKPGLWKVSDQVTTRAMNRVLEYQFSTEDVSRAASDLFNAYQLVKHFLRFPGNIAGPLHELPTWQYKPSSLKLVRRKSGS
jgi:hypothetical protein